MDAATDRVIAYAKAQRGKPYVFGATGPNAFDCSGLTMMAWAQVGVHLPHNSYMQWQATRRVYATGLHLEPGDLVFYYEPVSHVALYVGRSGTDPQVVQATNEQHGVEQIHMRHYADPTYYGRVLR